MFSRILVGVDAQGGSDAAVLRAHSLGARFESDLVLAHVVRTDWSQWAVGWTPPELLRELDWIESCRHGVLDHLRTVLPDRDAARADERLVVLSGRPSRSLLDHAEECKAELIVLGAHRSHPGAELGGTPRALLGTAPCPVWIEGTSEDAQAMPKEVLVSVDTPESGAEICLMARELAAEFEVGVRVLHVFQPPAFAYTPNTERVQGFPTYVVDDLRRQESLEFERFVEDFDWGGVKARPYFVEGTPKEEVVAARRPGDLLVLGTHGHGRLVKEILGSVAYAVLRKSEGSTVVVPLKKHRAAAEPTSEGSAQGAEPRPSGAF